jgi:hypothetical protein
VVVVPGQQRVGERAEPDQPAAHRPVRQQERGDAARHHQIGHVRAPAVEKGGGLLHARKIGVRPPEGYPRGDLRGRSGSATVQVTRSRWASMLPQIGIFWRVESLATPQTLLVDCVAVVQGEPYGDHVTYGAHYEFWSALARLSAAELRRRHLPDVVLWSEYEEWPRGRVVLHLPTNRFTIYADRKLRSLRAIQQITERFGLLEGAVDVRGDAHYTSVR